VNTSTIPLPDGIVLAGAYPDTVITWPNGNSRGATKPEHDLWRVAEAAMQHIGKLQCTTQTLTCVYCGHEYPPGSPSHGAAVLTEHIRVCEKHPMRKAESELAELRAWKESALAVEREWDAQAIAKLLGGRLGRSCRAIIAEQVPKLVAENAALRAALQKMVDIQESTALDYTESDWIAARAALGSAKETNP